MPSILAFLGRHAARGLDAARRDVRDGWRDVWRSPAFAATSILTLAVGLGLITAVFTVVSAYVLRPFAVRDPARLYEAEWRAPNAAGNTFTWQQYQDLAARADIFDGAAAATTRMTVARGQSLVTEFVSGNYFDLVGASIALGRPIAAFDAGTPGGAPVVVLSDAAWARLFDSDPAAIGRALEVNGTPVVVIGVAAPAFGGLRDLPVDAWLPITMYPALTGVDVLASSTRREIRTIVRLKAGVGAAHAEAALHAFMADAAAPRPSVRAHLDPKATPVTPSVELLALLGPIFAAFALVLVVACANVSNVMLARAVARQRDIGIRLALGAGRARIVRQLLAEGAIVAVLAGAAGLGLAAAIVRGGTVLLFATLPPSIASLVRVAPLGLDHRVFLFALACAGASALLFSLLPALQATRPALTAAMRGEAFPGLPQSVLRNALVVGQVAVSLVLLVVAVTLARNSTRIGTLDLGLRTADVVSVNERTGGEDLLGRAAAVLAAEPGVAGVAVTSRNPLFGQLPKAPVSPVSEARTVAVSYMFVSPDYFPLLDIPILAGRGFRPAEADAEAHVGIISAAGAAALWPGASALGRSVRLTLPATPDTAPGRDTTRRLDRDTSAPVVDVIDVVIVGVARDAVNGMVYEGASGPHVYMPTSAEGTHAGALLLRGRSPQDVGPDRMRAMLERVHPDAEEFEAIPLADMAAVQMYPLRVAAALGVLLAVVAVGLSASGLYGVLTFTLGLRTKEIGIRMALGATLRTVVGLVLFQSLRLAGLGAATGLVAAAGVLTLLASVVRLERVTVLDAGAFAISLALVAATALLAASLPSRRAARVDPSVTLRAET